MPDMFPWATVDPNGRAIARYNTRDYALFAAASWTTIQLHVEYRPREATR